ncbi:MAG: retroviral-like aspartic protease family protein [Methanocella sp.]
MSSFTIECPDLLTCGPVIDVEIAVPKGLAKILYREKEPVPRPITVSALIDTGATRTVVSSNVIKSLNLVPHDQTKVITATHDNIVAYHHHLSVTLPGGCVFELSDAVELPLINHGIECLVGREILKHGIFTYDGRATKISFHIVPP